MLEPAPGELTINEFELDSRNTGHFAHGFTVEVLYEVAYGPYGLFVNPGAATRSGSHRMIGPDAQTRFWTIVLLTVDAEIGLWRPITGWPSTTTEVNTWRAK